MTRKSISILVIGISALIALGLWRPWENAEIYKDPVNFEDERIPTTPIEQHVQCGYAKVKATVSCNEPNCWENPNNGGDELVKEVEMQFVQSTKEGCMFKSQELYFTTRARGQCDDTKWFSDAILVETNVIPEDIISGPTITAFQLTSTPQICRYTITLVVKKP